MILAVDPGRRCLGWSLWDVQLVRCGLVRTRETALGQQAHDLARQLPSGDHQVVVERPVIYPYARQRRPNDLIDLSFVAGACVLTGSNVLSVTPSEWKGQTPKDVNHRRVLSHLSFDELQVLKAGIEGVPDSLRHNVLDAVGLGRWHVTGERL